MFARVPVLLLLWISSGAFAATVSGGKLVEDFTSLDGGDFQTSTGLWNVIDHVAQAGAVANGLSTRPISFGDGSDGALTLSSGSSYTFNTDQHPNGYNFTSVSIDSGVTLNVTGSKPLIIRSLSTATISSTLSVDGEFGALSTAGDAVANGSIPGTGPTGGPGHACAGTGGNGGVFPFQQHPVMEVAD